MNDIIGYVSRRCQCQRFGYDLWDVNIENVMWLYGQIWAIKWSCAKKLWNITLVDGAVNDMWCRLWNE